MKKLFYFFAVALFGINVMGQVQQTANVPAPTPYAIVSQDGNSQVWESTTYELLPSGQVVPHLQHYTELATGLNYQQNGQWMPSQEQINIQPDGTASATAGQHQAYFPSDIYSGNIELVTPDGLQLQSQPLGLFYDDGSNTVMIAALTNSVGQLISSNQVIYTNAFTGADADLLYTYTKAGFEQDVILREQVPAPDQLGLNPDTARLQVLTEFFNAPQPTVSATTLPTAAGNLENDYLNFGTMSMGSGKAFMLGTTIPLTQVYKQWLVLDGRQILVEEVPLANVADQMENLPTPQAYSSRANPLSHFVSKTRLLPARRITNALHPQRIQIARADLKTQGLVLDYQALNGSLSDYTFQADTTYYISGGLGLYGTNNTFEGGTVIKFAANASLTIEGNVSGTSVQTHAGPYNPVVFTAVDDNSVGQSIGTGTLTNNYANPALEINYYGFGTPGTLDNIRISYAAVGIELSAGSAEMATLNNVQIVNCGEGCANNASTAIFQNGLFANNEYDFIMSTADVYATNVTFSGSHSLATNSVDSGLHFINCILANVPNLTNSDESTILSGSPNGFYNSPEFAAGQFTNTLYPFQTVGAGGYYLASVCNFRTNGTTSIDSGLLAELAQKTTYPPVVFSNTVIAYATNFMPQAQRDDSGTNLDLGYHYDPIDYVFGGVNATNLTFSAGAVMGWFGTSVYGIALPNSAVVTFNGTATSPCVDARYCTVQEGGNGNWTYNGSTAGIVAYGSLGGSNNASIVDAQFTHFAGLNNGPNFVRDDTSDFILQAKDCEFWSGNQGGYGIHDEFTNCLFNGTPLTVQAASSGDSCLTMENCTMREAYIYTSHWSYSTWPVWIQNSAFEGTSMSQMDTSPGDVNMYCDYNSFLTSTNQLADEGMNTVVVSNGYDWESGWFGNYYLPTNSLLKSQGSTTADQVGLYEFTTQTNEIPEGTNVVDIGYHYVTTDTNGNPLETYVSGIPNYIVDSQGNGIDTNGLPYWWEAQYFGQIGLISNSDPDADGYSLQYEYTNGLNPNNINSINPILLASWSFFNTNTWQGDQGQLPLLATNIVGATNWTTNAVVIDTNSPAYLSYGYLGTNEEANINVRNGSVCLWFNPLWTSTDQGGSGVAGYGRLIEMGNYSPTFTNAWWSVYLSQDGNHVLFASATNSAGMTNLVGNIYWTSNQWHQLVLTYTPTNSLLYLDGVLATNGGGTIYYPGLAERDEGLRIGGDINGTNQGDGIFADVKTFNYPVSPVWVGINYTNIPGFVMLGVWIDSPTNGATLN